MENQNPAFSVIIPLYNKEISVRSTIESVLNQTWPHFEIIIVNDGSTDNSLVVAQSFKDERIKIINQENQGVSNARNMGIQTALNEFVAFLDADDLWEPYALKEFICLISRFPKADVFSGNLTLSNKKVKGTEASYYVKDYYYSAAVLMAKWNVPLMFTGTVALRKSCLIETGGFIEGVTHGEDVEFWSRLSSRYVIAKSERVIMTYRQNSENRVSLMEENQKKHPIQETFKKKEIRNKSMQLFFGCVFFVTSMQLLKGFKLKKWLTLVTTYPNWIIRAALLYAKHRLFLIS